jgi:hypothetical protein
MADKNKSSSSESKKASQSTLSKIQVVGPKEEYNGSEILRFPRDGRKKPIEIVAGQTLTVGDGEDANITEDEAKRLMTYDRWEVKEVNNNG